MWRGLVCFLVLLTSLYLLNGGLMHAWLTAADPAEVEQHRTWCYACMGGALLAYVAFGVVLRPRSVLHFVLCSMAVLLLLISGLALGTQGWGIGWLMVLAGSAAYLLWRAWVVVNRG